MKQSVAQAFGLLLLGANLSHENGARSNRRPFRSWGWKEDSVWSFREVPISCSLPFPRSKQELQYWAPVGSTSDDRPSKDWHSSWRRGKKRWAEKGQSAIRNVKGLIISPHDPEERVPRRVISNFGPIPWGCSSRFRRGLNRSDTTYLSHFTRLIIAASHFLPEERHLIWSNTRRYPLFKQWKNSRHLVGISVTATLLTSTGISVNAHMLSWKPLHGNQITETFYDFIDSVVIFTCTMDCSNIQTRKASSAVQLFLSRITSNSQQCPP